MAKIFFLLGVSGSGKTTFFQESGILADSHFQYVQSFTTRALRPGEVNGEKYRHITKESFEQAIKDGDFLEYAWVHATDWYGTKYSPMIDPLADGINTIKEIEIQGLQKIQENDQIKGKYVSIFLDVSPEIMTKRITSRAPVSDEELANRLASAEKERALAYDICDYIIDAGQPLENVMENVIHILRTAV